MQTWWKPLSLVLAFYAAQTTTAYAQENHGSITMSRRAAGGKTHLVFKVVPQQGFVVNDEGPWALEIKETKPAVKLAQQQLKRGQWSAEIPGFEVALTDTKAPAKIAVTFRFIAFLCTKDKSTCYRDVYQQTLEG